jgi:Starch-binding associating with outer membrane
MIKKISMNKKLMIGLLVFIIGISSCKKFLDINSDPDTPQTPDPSSVFPSMLGNIPAGIQLDALWFSRYIQYFGSSTANEAFDQQGYSLFENDRGGAIWRQTYFNLGKNLDYIIIEGGKKGQWDYVGAAQALKAHMFQQCTNYHGEIIFRDAFKEDSVFFRFDTQELVYAGIDSLCRQAIVNLSRTDLNPASLRLSKGDYTYGGDLSKWRKFTYGLLARNFNNLSNKSIYKPDSVIKYCDLAMSSTTGADDFLIPFDATRNADANVFGTFRNNLSAMRQTNYIVRMLDGTTLVGNTLPVSRDPRLKHMLARSHDSTNGNGGYRGVTPGLGEQNTLNRRVAVPWGDTIYANPGSGDFSKPSGKYLFANKVVMPVMTYSEIQFMKAEAALRKGDRPTAYTAYRNGIDGHFNFINRVGFPRGNNVLFLNTPIDNTERNAYFASLAVKQNNAALTLSDIMMQKYIALWGWGFVETWCDMRRYHYTDLDPITGVQVYKDFTLPSPMFTDNNNKPAYRVRYRFNSEYVWNLYLPDSARTLDYHTKEMWFSKP